jgi:hypothetical protein
MNTNKPESPLESWERFLRAYVEKHGLKYEDVIQKSELVERLNILWLRTATAQEGKENPE